ncbi:hypothetical protein DFH27DRAFT_300583 [Peziza echinospora]|nr:hypothetical protein DFH27DRAFT_300583 [Peziza echinospora]
MAWNVGRGFGCPRLVVFLRPPDPPAWTLRVFFLCDSPYHQLALYLVEPPPPQSQCIGLKERRRKKGERNTRIEGENQLGLTHLPRIESTSHLFPSKLPPLPLPPRRQSVVHDNDTVTTTTRHAYWSTNRPNTLLPNDPRRKKFARSECSRYPFLSVRQYWVPRRPRCVCVCVCYIAYHSITVSFHYLSLSGVRNWILEGSSSSGSMDVYFYPFLCFSGMMGEWKGVMCGGGGVEVLRCSTYLFLCCSLERLMHSIQLAM